MSGFVCLVVDTKGERQTLVRDAAHEAAVLRDLNQEGFFILSVKPAAERAATVKKVKPSVVLEFTEVLATLMTNGLELKRALSIAENVGSASVRPFFKAAGERVAKGSSLCDALEPWRDSFSPLYLGLVRIGERTGDLASIFQRLSEYLQGRQAIRAKMKNSLVYPLFVLAVAVIGIVLLLTVILPKLSGMISSLNPEVAAAYRRNIGAFNVAASAIAIVILVMTLCVIITIRRRARDEDWARRLDALALKVPIAKKFATCSFGLNFAFAMEALLTSGYVLEDALKESSLVVNNAALRAGILSARDAVLQGRPLSTALLDEEIFPQVLTGWMAVGEGANDLVKSFSQVRAFYQRETDSLYSRFMNLAEPALIVAVGGVLIVLILTFITPIFTMLGSLI